VLDTGTNTTQTTMQVGTGSHKWGRGARDPTSGRIFFFPENADAVLQIDPVANTHGESSIA
jgi:hypothetical protein